MVNQLHTKSSLLIALDLCQAHYQIIVDNLSEGLHSDKCTDCKSCRRSCNQLIFRCFDCKKEFDKRKKNFDKELIK